MTIYTGFVIVPDKAGHSHAGVLEFAADSVSVPRVPSDVQLLAGHKGPVAGHTVEARPDKGGIWVQIYVDPEVAAGRDRIGVSPELTGVRVHKRLVEKARLARIAIVDDPAWETFLDRVDDLDLLEDNAEDKEPADTEQGEPK